MQDLPTLIEQAKSEMRRGLIVLATLSLLDKPHYGYSLIQTLEEKGIPIEGNTLYPLLRRLDKQGLLESSWETDTSKPRKYYQITDKGMTVLHALKDAYIESTKSLNYVLGVKENE